MYLTHMAEKLGFRLRQHALAAQKYFIWNPENKTCH